MESARVRRKTDLSMPFLLSPPAPAAVHRPHPPPARKISKPPQKLVPAPKGKRPRDPRTSAAAGSNNWHTDIKTDDELFDDFFNHADDPIRPTVIPENPQPPPSDSFHKKVPHFHPGDSAPPHPLGLMPTVGGTAPEDSASQPLDELIRFAQHLVLDPAEMVSDGDFPHCGGGGGPDIPTGRPLADAVTRSPTQHRPNGSVILINKMPPQMRDCPCKCTLRNPACGELDQYTLLCIFYEKGWILDNDPLHLFIPGFSPQVNTKTSPAVIGTLRVTQTPHGPVFRFHDSGTARDHCCPVSWFYFTFLDLCADAKIADIPAVALQVKEQMKLRSNCFRFVSVQALNVTLYCMAANYRHDIGMHQMKLTAGSAPAKIRIPFKSPPDVKFKSRQELKDFFATANLPQIPENTLWSQAQNRRIAALEQTVRGQTAQIATLKGSPL